MATQTYGALTNEQRNAYSMMLLARMIPHIPMFKYAKKDTIARRQGKTIEWRVFESFPRATTALTEGTPPGDTAFQINKYTATIAQYGAWSKMSDLLYHQGIDPLWSEASTAFGENAGQTLHTVLVNELAAGTNIRYSNAAAGRSSLATPTDNIDAAEIRRARRLLARANALKGVSGGPPQALIHPDTMEGLTADTTIQSVAQYGAGGESKRGGVDLLDGTVMHFGGFKFEESTDAPIFAGAGSGGADVHGSLFFGKDWFATVDLAAKPLGNVNAETNKVSGIEIKGVPVDQESRSDPLAQYGTIGWKALGFAASILQQARGLRIEHTVSA